MDNILKELFGGDEPAAAPATAAAPAAPAEAQATRDDEREARRAARQARKADPERTRKRDEFVERYTTGTPFEGFTAEEAIDHLEEMRDEMSPAEFRGAMAKTLNNLPGDERDEFIAMMKSHQAAASAAPAAGAGTRAADPFGGLLTGLMGGGAGAAGGADIGALFSDIKRGGLGAPSSGEGGKPTEADFQALINSPLGKAVLGGLAAYGLQGTAPGAKADADDHDTPGGAHRE